MTTSPAALAERHYVGALLHLRGQQARTAAAWVQPDDLADPQLRQVLATVQDLLRDGAMEIGNVAPRMVRTGRCPRDLAGHANMLLVDLLRDVPHPPSWPTYAATVLDEAMRRHVRECAQRLEQAATTDSLPSVVGVLADTAASVQAMAARIEVRP